MQALTVGERAPDFVLPDANGTSVQLYELLKDNVVVLFFYPKDDTPGCTKEACAFRDTHESFVEAGATVVGISSDDGPSHRRFVEKYKLPFTLVSDTTGAVRAAYRVPRSLLVFPGRTTFVIDKQGIVRHSSTHQRQAERHVSDALAALRSLR